MTERPKMQDPRAQYPAPPFPKQPQPAPGLASRLEPPADHGEASYRGSGRLKGRKALITGGDSGIGRAVAIAYAREGADVAIAHLPEERADAEEVVTLIRDAGCKAVTLPGDQTEEKYARGLAAQAAAELNGLDILVVNAAHQKSFSSFDEITTDDFDSTMRTNLYPLFWITQEAARLMPPGGAIVTTASIQAYDPSASIMHYATTKAGIVAFTKALSQELVEKGIRVNAVAPGPFWSPLNPSGGAPQEKVAHFGQSTVFGRPGQPAEIAPVYVLLASQEGSYITGEVYGVTGGQGIA
ncbi:MAG: NAD(P)-dependent dehydrogenase (short-subunit alcohol dehydrogenase family) [Limimaricola cinnabarinus]|jgi:NAD(P)-dependent dehydrogenase (short-subunit alcohol dehydrogenase family)|uniref:SDR family oxidoreductase n=1 Tax=Limimaricola cinnabarinus TaxID=1125964 RepID=UPI0039E54457